jgi:hypothetical protein
MLIQHSSSSSSSSTTTHAVHLHGVLLPPRQLFLYQVINIITLCMFSYHAGGYGGAVVPIWLTASHKWPVLCAQPSARLQ